MNLCNKTVKEEEGIKEEEEKGQEEEEQEEETMRHLPHREDGVAVDFGSASYLEVLSVSHC